MVQDLWNWFLDQSFLRELRSIGNKELAVYLNKIFKHIEDVESTDEIGGLVKLRNYTHYYRIRIKVSDTRDYRLVLTIRKNKVWAESIALASKNIL